MPTDTYEPGQQEWRPANYGAMLRTVSNRGNQPLQATASIAGGAQGGRSSDASHSKGFNTEEEAIQAFDRQKQSLFDVNHWDQLSGMENASFKLFDAEGQPTDRGSAQPGDFVRIDLPGPSGYDWVRVEDG